MDNHFSLERFISTKFPFENSKRELLINGLLRNKKDGMSITDIYNDFDNYIKNSLKLSVPQKQQDESFGEIFMMMNRFLYNKFNTIRIGMGSNCKTKRDYNVNYCGPLRNAKKEGLDNMEIIMNDVLKELDFYYSKSTKSIINFIKTKRKDKEGNIKFFQYEDIVKSRIEDKKTIITKAFRNFTLFIYDKKLPIISNYLIYNFLCLGNNNNNKYR